MHVTTITTVWSETLLAGKFGEFVAEFILAKRKFGKSSHRQTKIYGAKLQCNFAAYHSKYVAIVVCQNAK